MKKLKHVAVWVLGILVLMILVVVWGSYSWWPIPHVSGRLAARNDLAHGRYRILGYGLPPPGMPLYISILRQRYGVEYVAVAGCTPSKATLDYLDAYDDLSSAAIDRKFGKDVLGQVEDEAFGRSSSTPAAEDIMVGK